MEVKIWVGVLRDHFSDNASTFPHIPLPHSESESVNLQICDEDSESESVNLLICDVDSTDVDDDNISSEDSSINYKSWEHDLQVIVDEGTVKIICMNISKL